MTTPGRATAVSGDHNMLTRTDIAHLESAFRDGRSGPSTSQIIPDQEALSRFRTTAAAALTMAEARPQRFLSRQHRDGHPTAADRNHAVESRSDSGGSVMTQSTEHRVAPPST